MSRTTLRKTRQQRTPKMFKEEKGKKMTRGKQRSTNKHKTSTKKYYYTARNQKE